jgi:hypothetical protein
MQSWSGEAQHSERARLLIAVAERLGAGSSAMKPIAELDSTLPRSNYDLVEALELAFHYCARQVECRRHARDGDPQDQDWQEIRESFTGLLGHFQAKESSSSDDREGILHRMVEDFLDQLELLVPHPGRIP